MLISKDIDVQVGKWYPASQTPPDIHSENIKGKYDLLLGIQGVGVVLGQYSFPDDIYLWLYQDADYLADDSLSDQLPGRAVSKLLQWDAEPARGVSCWMIIPAFDKELPSYNGSSYFETEEN